MRARFSYGLLFELFLILRGPWWKNSATANKQELVINPTYNLRLVGNLFDTRGFAGIRGLQIWPNGTGLSLADRVEQNLFINLLIELAKSKGNPRREAALLSLAPPQIKSLLTQMDIVVGKADAPKGVRYKGLLEFPPQELVALDLPYGGGVSDRGSCVVGDNFFLQVDEQMPAQVLERIADIFGDTPYDLELIFPGDYPMLWCVNSCSGLLSHYSLSQEQLFILQGLIDGRFSAAQLPDDIYCFFRTLEVLIVPSEQEAIKAAYEKRMSQAKAFLEETGYVVLGGNLNFLQAAWQRRYYRDLIAGGNFMPCDPQCPGREAKHNEAYARFLHFQLVRVINKVLPEVVLPSYCYIGHYHGGADLKRHIDRAQCEWNASMPLDMFPNVNADESWPIYIQREEGREDSAVEVRLGIGDLVIYRGNKLYHWRDELPKGHTATVCFFHFVNDEFAGPLN